MKFQRTSNPANSIVLKGNPVTPSESRWMTLWKQIVSIASPDALWSSLAKFAEGRTEPIVEKRCDRQGHVFYAVYDPITHQRTICTSELEVRAWLEQRYYQ